MRPRHKAAEDHDAGLDLAGGESASMRPRHKAAEDPVLVVVEGAGSLASMRPRHKAAEDRLRVGQPYSGWIGFNEAAA